MSLVQHDSDCSTNNAPALPPGPCDCGAEKPQGGEGLQQVGMDVALSALRRIAVAVGCDPTHLDGDHPAAIVEAKMKALSTLKADLEQARSDHDGCEPARKVMLEHYADLEKQKEKAEARCTRHLEVILIAEDAMRRLRSDKKKAEADAAALRGLLEENSAELTQIDRDLTDMGYARNTRIRLSIDLRLRHNKEALHPTTDEGGRDGN